MSSSSSMSLIPFDGRDFALWKIKASAYLGGRGWSDVVILSNAAIPVAKIETEESKQKISENKSKAYAFLVNSLSNNILSLFANSAVGDPAVL